MIITTHEAILYLSNYDFLLLYEQQCHVDTQYTINSRTSMCNTNLSINFCVILLISFHGLSKSTTQLLFLYCLIEQLTVTAGI